MEAVLGRSFEEAPVIRTNSNSDTPGSLSQPHLDRLQLDEPGNSASPGRQRRHSRYRRSLEMPLDIP